MKKTYPNVTLDCTFQTPDNSQPSLPIEEGQCLNGVISKITGGFRFEEAVKSRRPKRNPKLFDGNYCSLVHMQKRRPAVSMDAENRPIHHERASLCSELDAERRIRIRDCVLANGRNLREDGHAVLRRTIVISAHGLRQERRMICVRIRWLNLPIRFRQHEDVRIHSFQIFPDARLAFLWRQALHIPSRNAHEITSPMSQIALFLFSMGCGYFPLSPCDKNVHSTLRTNSQSIFSRKSQNDSICHIARVCQRSPQPQIHQGFAGVLRNISCKSSFSAALQTLLLPPYQRDALDVRGMLSGTYQIFLLGKNRHFFLANKKRRQRFLPAAYCNLVATYCNLIAIRIEPP